MYLNRNLLSSIAVRQALLSIIVMLAAVASLAVATVVTIDRNLREDLLHTIDTDISGLTDSMVKGGPQELAARMIDRTDFTSSRHPTAYYRLTTAAGIRAAGNLPASMPVDRQHSTAGEFKTADDVVLYRATRLRGGYTLIVGRSLLPVAAMRQRIWTLFGLVGGGAVVLALIASAVAASRLARRVAILDRALALFAGGDYGMRSGVGPGHDELARLSLHIDTHLDWTERLIAAQRAISDNIAHELRTPLVHLDTRLLRAIDHNCDEAIAVELDAARADIRSVVSLFDALLDLALAEASGIAGSGSAFDVSEIAADLAELYDASAEEAGLDFSTRIAPAVMMRGEPMAMTRLIANLLDNAVKYVSAGARVRLIVADGPRIVVEDTGTGILDADRGQIFARFYRSEPRGQGHGLGLALVKVIASRHGLVARVEDAAPGARFVVEPAT